MITVDSLAKEKPKTSKRGTTIRKDPINVPPTMPPKDQIFPSPSGVGSISDLKVGGMSGGIGGVSDSVSN